MSKLEKMAKEDAYEWGLAQMFFGEGAGTRRKLVAAKIDQRVIDIPGYEEALDKAYAKIDQIEMAEKALALRKRIDRSAKAGKNLRAIRTGNLQNLSTGVFVAVGVVYVAHITGYDEVVKDEAKRLYRKVKTEVQVRKARKGLNL